MLPPRGGRRAVPVRLGRAEPPGSRPSTGHPDDDPPDVAFVTGVLVGALADALSFVVLSFVAPLFVARSFEALSFDALSFAAGAVELPADRLSVR
jgi:hypothetical protein